LGHQREIEDLVIDEKRKRIISLDQDVLIVWSYAAGFDFLAQISTAKDRYDISFQYKNLVKLKLVLEKFQN
jgi:hypothetical protein